jgi:hypothetical protein
MHHKSHTNSHYIFFITIYLSRFGAGIGSHYSDQVTSWTDNQESWGGGNRWGQQSSSLLQSVQTGPGAHTPFYSMDAWSSFPGDKAAGE